LDERAELFAKRAERPAETNPRLVMDRLARTNTTRPTSPGSGARGEGFGWWFKTAAPVPREPPDDDPVLGRARGLATVTTGGDRGMVSTIGMARSRSRAADGCG